MSIHKFHLDFERPIIELEDRLESVQRKANAGDEKAQADLVILKMKLENIRKDVFGKLSRWHKVQVARHPKRPYTLDYIERLSSDFIELHGDRGFRDDPAIIGGFANFSGHRVMVVGQQKGKNTKENIKRNFGMMHPEGYRKALRLFKLAAKFHLPVVIFIDTPGAYPGIGAEERGQAEAIARNIFEMGRLPVPIIILIIGEGASGGALGIGVGDSVLMMENAWYSVISPEGCAAILWRDRAAAPKAAEALKLTAPDLLELGMIDKIIPEPIGGAHSDPEMAAKILEKDLLSELVRFSNFDGNQIVEKRFTKYRNMGIFTKVKV
ncbi:acetyl-CoA carboxylase carboxyltransferase subunit alpha [bacterium]|nr:acetyl-CoA carboxylase carboxyltransferase subunit alpha [bacterium]